MGIFLPGSALSSQVLGEAVTFLLLSGVTREASSPPWAGMSFPSSEGTLSGSEGRGPCYWLPSRGFRDGDFSHTFFIKTD